MTPLLLLFCAVTNPVVPMPLLTIPPPRTNLYSITIYWTNALPCFIETTVFYGTNWLDYNRSQVVTWSSPMTMTVSNLNYGVTWFFEFAVAECATPTLPWPFPPAQLPYTNTVTITYPGTLLMAMSGGVETQRLKYFTVTNRVFRLDQRTNYFWTGQGATNEITYSITNNQVNYYKKFAHRQ